MAEGVHRPAWVEVDLSAIEHNARLLTSIVAPARVCAVVKADAYGHGAVEVAEAALAGGATDLAVAMVDEGVELRDAGVHAPILVLSEPASDAMAEAFAYRLTPTLYTPDGIALASEGAGAVGAARWHRPAPVEIKIDTGMHRVGADSKDLLPLVRGVGQSGKLEFAGLWTHLAVADEPDNGFTLTQLERFEDALKSIAAAGLPAPGRVHAANSAGALAWPSSRLDMVRCGIALYGYSPSPELAGIVASLTGGERLRPALSMVAKVASVRELGAGERVSYGLCKPLASRSLVATVPLGYADGIPRAYFSSGGSVLLGGRRRPLAGTVTMDQIMIDCGDDWAVAPGDEVVLIGSQGGEHLSAEDWARSLETICYEVVTRIGPRVPRVYSDSKGRITPSATAQSGR